MQQDNAEQFETMPKAGAQELRAVTEVTIYTADFPIFLRRLLDRSTLAEIARHLETSEEYVQMLINGQKYPTSHMLKKLGLRTLYALPRSGPFSHAAMSLFRKR